MIIITDIKAREILDSRGIPTVEVDVILSDGSLGRASVPSGASTGVHEAYERRDNDMPRHNGKGVLEAVNVINTIIYKTLLGHSVNNQLSIDSQLIKLDGTPDKRHLGANSILAVSLAAAKAAANSIGEPLYRYIGGINAHRLPLPMINILNGGKHADNPLSIQEFMIVPIGAKTFSDAICMGAEVFHTLKALLKKNGCQTNVGDEGGFAPQLPSTEEALNIILQSVEIAGYHAGKDISLALDMAASELYRNGYYHLDDIKRNLTSGQLIDYYADLTNSYPIVSIEDGIAEDDWNGWQMMTERLGHKIQLVGDDLFTTNAARIKRGIENKVANAVLIKPNQIGTLSETLTAIDTARQGGYRTIISHRSGETEDTTIADLAVATNCGQIKIGSLSRSERLTKYNQLLRIAEDLGQTAVFSAKDLFYPV